MSLKLYTLPLFLWLPFIAAAQDSSRRVSQLNEITVTATKGPQKASETGKVVTILSHEYLEKNSGKTIMAILNEQTGLVINGAQNNKGTIPDVFMRGASNGNTLILIDGLPVNDASQIANTFDLNFISPEQVESIEILRGSQSTLYGSNAVAGVINIITRKNNGKKLGATVNASYGSYRDVQGSLNVYGNAGKFSYLLGYKYQNTAGFSDAYDTTHHAGFDKDGFRQHTVFAKAGFQASSKWQLQYLFNYSNYRHSLDEGANIDDKDYTGKFNYLMNGISSEYKFNKGSWHILYSVQTTERKVLNDSADIAIGGYGKFDNSKFTSETNQVETYVNWNVAEMVRIVAGGAFTASRTNQKDWYLGTFPNATPYITELSQDSTHTNQTSVYASVLLHSPGGFNMEAGGRFNYHNVYGSNQTFSFNPSYLINQQHKIFINIASAYKVPSLYQLYAGEYGNRDLKPESTTSYEAGYQAAVAQNAVEFRLTGFARSTRNLIIYYTDASFRSQYRNADKQRAYGAEAEASWHIAKGIDLNVNYTYVDGKLTKQLDNNKDTSYYNLYRIPKHAVNATLGYQITPALYTSATFKYVGQRYQEKKAMGDYYTVDLYGEYKFGNLLKIFTGFRNITDYQYFDILGYNSRRFNFNTGIILNL